MKKQKKIYVVKGISQDLSNARSNDEYAFSALNARISVNSDNDLLSVSNERGTLNTRISFAGTLLGYTKIEDYIVLFTTEDAPYQCEESGKIFPTTDRIYRFHGKSGELSLDLLYKGNLNFEKDAWIESLGVVETSNQYSVYWVDGVNPLGKLNIKIPEHTQAIGKKFAPLSCKDNYKIVSTDRFSFNEKVKITKKYDASSQFNAGVVQYALTYFNLNGRESSVFYWSPINYLTFENRAGSGEDKVTSSFEIRVDNLSDAYEYVRLYSIVRTSLEGTPIVSRVSDKKITGPQVIFKDNNTGNAITDPTLLLYLESNNVVANTLTQKDNTLFLGNYRTDISKELVGVTNSNTKSFIDGNKRNSLDSFWLNKNQSEITYFRKGESYNLGVVFRKDDGTYSNVHYLESFVATESFEKSNLDAILSSISTDISVDSSEYIQAIPVIKYNTPEERRFVAQGFLNPTVYSVKDRLENRPYAFTSWFLRPNEAFKPYIPENDPANPTTYSSFNDEPHIGTAEFRNGFILPYSGSLNAEMPNQPLWGFLGLPRTHFNKDIKEHKGAFIVDKNLLSFFSSVDVNSINSNLNALDVYLTGILPINKNRVSHNAVLEGNNNLSWEHPDGYNRDTTEYDRKLIAVGGIRDHGGENQSVRILGNYLGEDDTTAKVEVGERVVSTYIQYPWHHSGFITGETGAKIKTQRLVNYASSGFPLLFNAPIPLDCDKAIVRNNEGYKQIESDGYKNILSNVNELITTPDYLKQNTYPIFSMREGENLIIGTSTPTGGIGDFTSLDFYLFSPDMSYASFMTLAAKDYSYERSNLYDLGKRLNGKARDTFRLYSAGIFRAPGSLWAGQHKTYNLSKTILYSEYHLYDVFRKSSSNVKHLVVPTDRRVEETPGVGNYQVSYPIPLTYKAGDSIAIKLKDSYLPDYLYRYENGIHSDNKYKVLGLFRFYATDTMLPFYRKLYYDREDRKEAVKLLLGYDIPDPYIEPSEADLQTIFEREVSALGIVLSGTKQDRIDAIQSFIDTHNIEEPDNHGAYYEGTVDNVTGKDYSVLNIDENIELPDSPYLFSAEIVNRNVIPYEHNELDVSTWTIAGEPVKLNGGNGTLIYSVGDFYLGKVTKVICEPLSEGKQNNVTEMLDYMEETPVNIHGDYSKQTKLDDLDMINPAKVSSINEVYSQRNNYKQYDYIPKLLFNTNDFPSSFLWSKEKHYGAVTDAWMNISTASNYQLDGDKGTLNYLETYRDNIIAFQENGVANIIFNPRVQIPVSDGVPVEIGNSMKVEGKRYLSDKIGCQNKWSIIKSASAVYFIDSNSNTLYTIGEGLANLSDKHGFRSFFEEGYVKEPKNINKNNFLSLYDEVNNRLYFASKDYALCFNELTDAFESFFSYPSIRAMFSMNNSNYSISLLSPYVWEHNKGEYGKYYDREYPWNISYRVKGESVFPKTFTNVEFRADTFLNDRVVELDFKSLEAATEYQQGKADLKYSEYLRSTLKKQNRVWFADIPRDGNSLRSNRILNPWVELTLEGHNKNKTVLHDFVVNYFE